jgi:hypothetical protein
MVKLTASGSAGRFVAVVVSRSGKFEILDFNVCRCGSRLAASCSSRQNSGSVSHDEPRPDRSLLAPLKLL